MLQQSLINLSVPHCFDRQSCTSSSGFLSKGAQDSFQREPRDITATRQTNVSCCSVPQNSCRISSLSSDKPIIGFLSGFVPWSHVACSPTSQGKIFATAETIHHLKAIYRILSTSFTWCGLQEFYKHISKTLFQAKWHLTDSYISFSVYYLDLSHLRRVLMEYHILCNSSSSLHEGVEFQSSSLCWELMPVCMTVRWTKSEKLQVHKIYCLNLESWFD